MKAKKIKEGVYWVGAIDWDLRNFHGYLTQKGSTYNAYLIVDEKITLIDAVKATLKDQLWERVKSVIDPKLIDYVVVNHVEMDHSGSLPQVIRWAPQATIVTNSQGKSGLENHFGNISKEWDFHLVSSGDELSLGKRRFAVRADTDGALARQHVFLLSAREGAFFQRRLWTTHSRFA